MEIETPCTCGHPAASHNALGVCFAQVPPHGGLCSCADFTTDDVAVAKAAGVLAGYESPVCDIGHHERCGSPRCNCGCHDGNAAASAPREAHR